MSHPDLPARLVDLDEDYPATLEEACRSELLSLWSDLSWARYSASNGCWSMACENITQRIVGLTRLVGAVRWEEIDADLTSSGLYERIHAEAGLEHPPVDWVALRAFQAGRRAEFERPLTL